MLSAKMLLSPISLTRKANILKIGGSFGGAIIATIVLEAAAQIASGASSKVEEFGSNELPGISAVPFIGDVTVKDVPSLIPAAAGVITVLKGRTKIGALMIVGSVGAKAVIRSAGYNPDEIESKLHRIYDKYILKKEPDEYETDEPQVYF